MRNINISGKDFEGLTLAEISNKKIVKKWNPLFMAALKGERVSTEYRIGNYYYLIRVSPLYDSDNLIHAGMAVVRNITGEKLSEKILKKSKEEAVEARLGITRFIARVSHEIRTPLGAVIGFCEQLLQTELSAEQTEYLKIIDQSSELLLSLVNDILEMSKIEANQISFESHNFKIGNTVSYVFKALAMKAEQKNLEFGYNIDESLNMVLSGDSFRLQQIIMNLLSNAIKFTNNGSVKLSCSKFGETEEKVSVKFEVAETILKNLNYRFEVASNGMEALSKLSSSRYDLVLLDIHMPDISGIDVARYLRGERKDRDTRIIAVTAAVLKDDIARYKSAGIDDFIVKLFRENHLNKKIREVLIKGGKSFTGSSKSNFIEESKGQKPYDLSELIEMAGNDSIFVKNTIGNLRQFLNEKNWEQIGEISHKILPSYRHLKVKKVSVRLNEIKSRTMIEQRTLGLPEFVKETIEEIEKTIAELRKELPERS